MSCDPPDEERIERLERLERRLARERAARLEAERIAEEGMLALWQHTVELDEQVERRTRDLSVALEAATSADRTRRAFLGQLGHELATPLHGVLGRLELINQQHLSATDRRRLEEARHDAATLAKLLEGLVALAAAEGGDRRRGPSDETATAVLDRIAGRWAAKLAGRGQLLVPVADAGDQPVRAEWDRVDEIADVFLDNVVRFADSGSVRVEITVGSDTVELAVSDVGPGLTIEQLAEAVAPFVQIASGGRLGVGLAIASRIAELGGGEIRLAESAEGGLRASVTLPHGPDAGGAPAGA